MKPIFCKARPFFFRVLPKGRAFRNIGFKYTQFSTVKSALFLFRFCLQCMGLHSSAGRALRRERRRHGRVRIPLKPRKTFLGGGGGGGSFYPSNALDSVENPGRRSCPHQRSRDRKSQARKKKTERGRCH